MNPLIALLIILAVGVLVFVFTHLHPLSDEQVTIVAGKRRQKAIRSYFVFDRSEYRVDSQFKSNMNPQGKFYAFEEHLHRFPATAAALLKYKKHEWIIIAFERNQIIYLVWMNKGWDQFSVASFLTSSEVAHQARRHHCDTVIICHNHPNPDPSMYDCTRASETDLVSANAWSSILGQSGVSLVEFVCERGMHYEYYRSISDEFMSIRDFAATIAESNGTSKWTNLMLHTERVLSPFPALPRAESPRPRPESAWAPFWRNFFWFVVSTWLMVTLLLRCAPF